MKDLKILVVDDDTLQRKTLGDLLARWKHETQTCECLSDAGKLMEESDFDLVLLDMRLPDGDGLQFMDERKKLAPDLGFVIITAYADIQTAVAAIKCGAYDYLPKPFEYEQLQKIIRNFSSTLDLRSRVSALSRLTSATDDIVGSTDEIVVETDSVREVYENAQRIAGAGDTTVLILGASGTGKGLMARAIHRFSPRASQPFIDINCSAIPEQLMESELFGYERGAFTDAKNKKIGLLEAADGGTVLLDEIGDMSVNLQGKILKVIEEKEFRRLGSARSTHVDIRIIAATSRNLQDRIRQSLFREDLYYRLSVFPITLPPLKDRRECILPLAKHYLEIFNRKLDRGAKRIAQDSENALLRYDWPGNIRELRNVIERGVILSRGDALTPRDLGLPDQSAGPAASIAKPASTGDTPGNHDGFVPMTMAEHEKRLIAAAIKHAKGNRSKAAEILQIHRTTLHKKIQEYGLKNPPA